MQSRKPSTFVPGPASSPPGALLEWLNQSLAGSRPRRRVRLPVAVHFEDSYRLGYGPVYVGTSPGGGDGAIHLELDDTGLSNALLTTLAEQTPESEEACVLWLEGYWGPLMDGLPDFDLPGFEPAGPKRWPFAVLAVGEAIAAGDSASHVLVEPAS